MAAQDEVAVRLRLRDARKFQSDAKRSGKSIRGLGDDTRYANARARAASKTFDGYKTGLLTVGKYAAIGGAAVGGLAGVVGGFAYSAFNESRKVVAQTGAVIKSTGGVANVTAKDVSGLATAISNKTGIDDEAIASGSNLLLTFTNIRNEAGKGNKVFDQTTKAAVDMAAALGTDTKSAAMQLGKALNDPTKGVTKLMRSGVTFTDAQKDQIKALQESGDMLGAQKIILREVSKEFGGSAAAIATPWDKLKVTFGNLMETIGGKLAPFIDKAAKFLNRFIKQMVSGKGQGGAFVKTLKNIADGFNNYVVKPAVTAVKGIIDLYNGFKDGKGWAVALIAALAGFATFVGVIKAIGAVTKLWAVAQLLLNGAMAINPFVLAAAAIAGLGVALVIAYKKSKSFRNIVNAVWGAVKTAAHWVGTAAPAAFNALWGVLKNLPLVYVIRHFRSIVDYVKGLPGKISNAATGMWDGIKNSFKGAINWIIRGWNGLQFTMPSINTHIPGVGKVGGFTVGVPDIPLLAKGGTITRGGSAIVGDAGPEVLNLPRGAQVQPLRNRAMPSVVPAGLGGEIVIHNVMELDGKVVYENFSRRVANKQARR